MQEHVEEPLGLPSLGAPKYCKEVLQQEYFDYLIFGHRHLPIDFTFEKGSRYINLGDWLRYYTYAVFYDGKLTLTSWMQELENKIIRK